MWHIQTTKARMCLCVSIFSQALSHPHRALYTMFYNRQKRTTHLEGALIKHALYYDNAQFWTEPDSFQFTMR